LFIALSSRLGNWAAEAIFWVLGGLTVVSAAATISARSPVYSAVWFAFVLLGTAGLFLVQGAQFLGVATIVVYAGAILVTFLFVLMLAQPEGHTYFDRLSWEPLLSSATGAVMVGMLTMAIGAALQSQAAVASTAPHALGPVTAAERADNILAAEHVATLGRQLFSRHLIAVEVAGALLLAALVGAVAIVAQGKEAPTHDLAQHESPASAPARGAHGS
jgi:NADH-quinone oxidoreductase subunit J